MSNSQDNKEDKKDNFSKCAESRDTITNHGNDNIVVQSTENKGVQVNHIDKKNIKQFFLGNKTKNFTVNDARTFKDEDMDFSQHLFVYPEEQWRDLRRCLLDYRILLLSGPPESGKFFAAKNLAIDLFKENRHTAEKIYWVNPAAADYNIVLGQLIYNDSQLKNKIIIFNKIFSHENNTSPQFFRAMNPEETADVGRRLRQLDAFILFTADSDTVDNKFFPTFAFRRPIAILGNELLKKGLERKLAHFCNMLSGRDYDCAIKLLEEKQKEIISRAKTMSKISLFIDKEMDKILAGKTVEISIREFFGDPAENINKWFFNNSETDKYRLETSTFALTLSLFNGIPLPEFNNYHRKISIWLLKTYFPYEPYKDFYFAFSKGPFLEICRADYIRDENSETWTVAFTDTEFRDAFQQILWKHHKEILLTIMPLLEKFLNDTNDTTLYKILAENLLRYGSLAPGAFIVPLIERWAGKEENNARIKIAIFYEILYNGDDGGLKKCCMKKLEEIAVSGNLSKQLTAVVIYKYIGYSDLEFAMKGLMNIALADKGEKFIAMLDLLKDIEDEDEFMDKMEQYDEEIAVLLSYIRYSIVALAFRRSPPEIFMELRKWLNSGHNYIKMCCVSLTLEIDGILDELTEQTQIISREGEVDKAPMNSSFLMIALTEKKSAPLEMAEFLADLYFLGFPNFKKIARDAFKKRFFMFIGKWTTENLAHENIIDSMKILLSNLYFLADNSLKDSLWNSITRWTIIEKKSNPDTEKMVKNNESAEKAELEIKLNCLINVSA